MLHDIFDTKLFNTHITFRYPLQYNLEKYRKCILIKNHSNPVFTKEEIGHFGGICLDICHLEKVRLAFPSSYQQTLEIIKEYPIKANHISVLSPYIVFRPTMTKNYDEHHFINLKDFYYLKSIPEKFFSQYLALGLRNNISDQLKVKTYLEEMLNL